jgi:hypothetical protein
MGLEGARLFEVKGLEVLFSVELVEAIDRGGGDRLLPRPLATFRKSTYLRFTRSFAALHLVTVFNPVSSAHWREGLGYRLYVAPLSEMRCRDRRIFSRLSLELRLGTLAFHRSGKFL